MVRASAILCLLLVVPVVLPAQDSDAEQASRDINEQLKEHPELGQVRAAAKKGIVTLDGTVGRYADRLLAERLAGEAAPHAAVRDLVSVSGPRVPDDELQHRVRERLEFAGVDHGMSFRNLHVETDGGVVTLKGDIHGDIDRASAIAIAGQVPGVQQVIDRLSVDPASERDEDIRVRAARAIYGDPALQKYAADPQPPIRIVVEHGALTLYGVVENPAERRIAAARAREVPGVFSVVNNLVIAAPADTP